MALICSLAVPDAGKLFIHRGTLALTVHKAEHHLGPGIPMFCRLVVKSEGLVIVAGVIGLARLLSDRIDNFTHGKFLPRVILVYTDYKINPPL